MENCGRKKVVIEYPLSTRTPKMAWKMIGDAADLQKWVADKVDDHGEALTFTWGESWSGQDVKVSKLVDKRKFSHIRLKWEQEHDDNEYWEMRITESKCTGDLALTITDFADDGDEDGLRTIWRDSLNRLHTASGL